MNTFYLEGPGGIPALKQVPSGSSAHTKIPFAFEGGLTSATGGTVMQNAGMLSITDSGQAVPGANAGIDSAFSHVMRLYNNFATGSTQIVTPNGNVQFYVGGNNAFNVESTGAHLAPGTAVTAGGALAASVGSAAGPGIYFGSGAPTVSAQQGSLYLRTDGSSGTRAYINNSSGSGTTWTGITTAA